jgi:hypothetical protein
MEGKKVWNYLDIKIVSIPLTLDKREAVPPSNTDHSLGGAAVEFPPTATAATAQQSVGTEFTKLQKNEEGIGTLASIYY